MNYDKSHMDKFESNNFETDGTICSPDLVCEILVHRIDMLAYKFA